MCRSSRSDVILFEERGGEGEGGEVVEPTPGAPNQERAMAHPPPACLPACDRRLHGEGEGERALWRSSAATVADFPPKM